MSLRKRAYLKEAKNEPPDATIFVKFASHRARQRGLGHIGDPNRQGYWSLQRSTGKGVYKVTQAEYESLKKSGIKGISKFKDLGDLGRCWDMGCTRG